MTERLVIRDRNHLKDVLSDYTTAVEAAMGTEYDCGCGYCGTWDCVKDKEAQAFFQLFASADFSGLYEEGTQSGTAMGERAVSDEADQEIQEIALCKYIGFMAEADGSCPEHGSNWCVETFARKPAELPKEEARLFTDADVKLLQWVIDDEKGDWRRHRRPVMSWRHVEAVSNLRDRIAASLIDSSPKESTAELPKEEACQHEYEWVKPADDPSGPYEPVKVCRHCSGEDSE